jgi:hypothetical protein
MKSSLLDLYRKVAREQWRRFADSRESRGAQVAAAESARH